MVEFLDSKQRKDSGFEYIVNKLEVYSYYGKNIIENLEVFNDENSLVEEFSRIEMIKEVCLEYPKLINEVILYLARIKNIDSIVNSLDYLCLDEVDLFEIKRFIFNVIKLKNSLVPIENKMSYLKLNDFSDLFSLLDIDHTQKPFFNISSSYSQHLKHLRSQNREDEIIQKEIKAEEFRIRKELTQAILAKQDDLHDSIRVIGYLDVLIAKAKLALEYNLNKPYLSANYFMVEAFNPMIKDVLANKNYEYQLLNIAKLEKINLITGSNMSGKSVSLKNIIVNSLCFMHGIYPFAKEFAMPIVDYIYYISDELQDVSNSLSSFGKEIVVLNQVIEQTSDKFGIIIFDELARGTNPVEGARILQGLVKFLNNRDNIIVLSTHLELKIECDYLHYQTGGLAWYQKNYLVEKSIQELMDYRLYLVEKTSKVPNDALKVMKLLKLNTRLQEVIADEYEGS